MQLNPVIPVVQVPTVVPQSDDFSSVSWRKAQREDLVIKHFINFLEYGTTPAFSCDKKQSRMLKGDKPIVKRPSRMLKRGEKPLYHGIQGLPNSKTGFEQATTNLSLDRNGVLYLNTKAKVQEGMPTRVNRRIVVPQEMIMKVLQRCHNDPRTGAHAGRDKMLQTVHSQFYWERMNVDVSNYVKSCLPCRRRKPTEPKMHGFLQPIDLEDEELRPFSVVLVDVAGPLPVTSKGNCYILVMVDHLSKWKIAVPLQDNSSASVCEALYRELVLRFMTPQILITDQGKEFISQATARLAQRLGINHRFSTAHHHQTAGEAERFIRWLKDTMSIHLNEHGMSHREWDQGFLQEIVHCYNRAVHPTTGETPFFLLYGQPYKEPNELINGPAPEAIWDSNFYKMTYLKDLRTAWKVVEGRMKRLADERKAKYDDTHIEVEFNVGDKVLVWTPPSHTKGEANKLKNRWTGPWRVVARRELNSLDKPINYELEAEFNDHEIRNRKTHQIVHVSRLRLFVSEFQKSGIPNVWTPTITSHQGPVDDEVDKVTSRDGNDDQQSTRAVASEQDSLSDLNFDSVSQIAPRRQYGLIRSEVATRLVRNAPSDLEEHRRSNRLLQWDDNSEIMRQVIEHPDNVSTGSSALTEIWASSYTRDVIIALVQLKLTTYKHYAVPEESIVGKLNNKVSEYRIGKILRSLSMSTRGHVGILEYQLSTEGTALVSWTKTFQEKIMLLRRSIPDINMLVRRVIADITEVSTVNEDIQHC